MKKLLSILLAVTIVMGMSLSVSADTLSTQIKKINESDFKSILSNVAASGRIVLNDSTKLSLTDLADLEAAPGDVIKIYMSGNMFTDANGKALGSLSTEVPLSYLSRGDVTVRMTATQGAGAATVTLDGNKSRSYIKIEFSRSPAYNNTKFAYSIYLAKGGSRKSVTRVGVRGTVKPDNAEVNSYDEYYDISDGSSVKATSNIKNFELIIGDGCSIIRNLTRGRTYSGIAINDILKKDEPLFAKYFYLDHIYRLETIGLKTAGNIVHFDLGEKYYVYNTHGTYIGTTDTGLPFWTKYYLSSRKYDSIDVIK